VSKGKQATYYKYGVAETTNICAKICYYAQEHSCCEEAWGPRNIGTVELHAGGDLDHMMQHTSYTIACFISQLLDESVEWDVVQEELIGPVMDEDWWAKVIAQKIEDYS
jgi:hypothetical protein